MSKSLRKDFILNVNQIILYSYYNPFWRRSVFFYVTATLFLLSGQLAFHRVNIFLSLAQELSLRSHLSLELLQISLYLTVLCLLILERLRLPIIFPLSFGLVIVIYIAILTLSLSISLPILMRAFVGERVTAKPMIAMITHAFGKVTQVYVLAVSNPTRLASRFDFYLVRVIRVSMDLYGQMLVHGHQVRR